MQGKPDSEHRGDLMCAQARHIMCALRVQRRLAPTCSRENSLGLQAQPDS